MKKSFQIALGLFSFIFLVNTATLEAQAFKKGCLLLSISEGSTSANYSTTNHSANLNNLDGKSTAFYSSDLDGIRDPLFIEFGLSNRWGIGLSSGNDLFTINPTNFYSFQRAENKTITAKTSEFTFDINYHFYTRKRVDFSAYTSLGSFGVAFSGKDGDQSFNYNAKGGIARLGVKARYYFWKRLGVMGMLSTYTGTASPDGISGNTVGSNTTTTIKGTAMEFGLCFRFF